ncbi:gastrula zinc finger protein XlCGF7.1-like [Toxorhynchites rutilus septentrionalis]|uniref:gastrula zinc finger protein XlCGF7.1-like n=1 Tax=Toxorhynchites rutilus septentrionalis TaxID=329112 RepID=UPI002479418A|nr:gastrula zinc finger protein XlCGF7.1-like [Toxorhynchites rutilus septentrionalis]
MCNILCSKCEKPHKCTVCDKRFIQATQLRSHMFHHTGENGFDCDNCGMAFNRKARLDEHIRFVHNKEYPLQCEVCSKGFMRKEDLSRHMDSHSDVKNFACDQCSKRFVSRTAMKLHQRTHAVEAPATCHICERTFIRKDCLVRHLRTRHREEYMKDDSQRTEENLAPTSDGTVLVEVMNDPACPEADPTVLEIDGEVYQITPVDDIQIVQIKSNADIKTNSELDNNNKPEILEVVTLIPPSDNPTEQVSAENLKET